MASASASAQKETLKEVVQRLCTPSRELVNKLISLKKQLESLFRDNGHPTWRLLQFGSRSYFIVNSKLDVEFCLRTGGQNQLTAHDCVLEMNRIFGRAARFRKIQPILDAPVPIITMEDEKSGFDIDICVENFNGLRLTAIMRCIRLKEPKFQVLGVAIKELLMKRQCLGGKYEYLGGEALLVMLAYYFQKEGLIGLIDPKAVPLDEDGLPVVAGAAGVGGPVVTTRPPSAAAQGGDFEDVGQESDRSLDDLLIGFFDFYKSESLWHDFVIDITQESYAKSLWFSNVGRSSQGETAPRPVDPMVVVCPTDGTRNVACAVKDEGYEETIRVFETLAADLQANRPGLEMVHPIRPKHANPQRRRKQLFDNAIAAWDIDKISVNYEHLAESRSSARNREAQSAKNRPNRQQLQQQQQQQPQQQKRLQPMAAASPSVLDSSDDEDPAGVYSPPLVDHGGSSTASTSRVTTSTSSSTSATAPKPSGYRRSEPCPTKCGEAVANQIDMTEQMD